MSAAVSSAGPDAVASSHDIAAVALALRPDNAEALRCSPPLRCPAASAFDTSLFMHVCQEAFRLSQAAFCGAVNVHHEQSVLLRVHKRCLPAASVTTAHRVCGKWPWPLLWPANRPSGAEVPGCERRITVSGLVSRRSAFLRPGSGTPQ